MEAAREYFAGFTERDHSPLGDLHPPYSLAGNPSRIPFNAASTVTANRPTNLAGKRQSIVLCELAQDGRGTCGRRALKPVLEKLRAEVTMAPWNRAGYFGEKNPRRRHSHTIEQWITHAAASAWSASSRASSRPSSRPSSAGSRASTGAVSQCSAWSHFSQMQAVDEVSVS